MKCETDEMTKSSGRKELLTVLEGFRNAIWIVPGVTSLVVILFLTMGHTHVSETGRKFLTSLVYSALIGLPSAVLLTWISYRFSCVRTSLQVLMQTTVLVVTGTLGSLAAGIVFQIAGILPREEYWVEFRGSYPFALVITLMVGLIATWIETMRHKLQSATLELRTRQVEQERANKLLAEARLSSLESRIHPHFLFNTLNSIASLIPSNPERAEATVGKLASLLRFSLNANQSGLVLLSQELRVVRDYLDIEQTRFGSRLRYEIDAPDEVLMVRVPPLALQSLVENSIKHVAAQRAQGVNIQIAASTATGQVELEVADDGPGFSLDAISPEHGLGNLISRLELLFGEQGKLNVTRKEDRTIVSLSFPIS
jgi:two-component system sensor histidine kinase AlgZ